MTANLYAALFSAAEPHAVFLETGDGGTVTYAEMDRMAAKVAGALIAKGLKPGDRVIAQAEKTVSHLALYLGTLKAGGVFVPVNTGYTASETEHFIADAEPIAVVRDADEFWAQAKGAAPFTGVAAREADDLAAILYTSGTTGRSKGAMLTHRNLQSNAEALVSCWRMAREDVLLHALPIYHTHGLFVALNTMMMVGGRVIFLPKFDAAEILRLMPKASVMMGVPTFYVRLLDSITRVHASHMRLFVSGSAPLLAETHRAWKAATGHDILERYGMTETSMITSNPYEGERRPGAVGFPLPGVELRLNANSVIEVRGPNVFKGYWRDAAKTAESFNGGWFITGDLGQIDADGYVHIMGRARDLIISGGLNVYPKEVEDRLLEIPGITDAAVIGVPHKDFGEAVVAVCTGAGNEADVLASLAERLAKFKCPKRVIFIDALPHNAMAKVQKNALRQQYAGLFA